MQTHMLCVGSDDDFDHGWRMLELFKEACHLVSAVIMTSRCLF